MKRMLNDEQIFELQELLEQVSISSGIVNFNKIHTEELTISDNGKWNGSGIFIDDLTMLKDNSETPQQLLPLSVANAGKVLAVGEDGESVDAVEQFASSPNLLTYELTPEDIEDGQVELNIPNGIPFVITTNSLSFSSIPIILTGSRGWVGSETNVIGVNNGLVSLGTDNGQMEQYGIKIAGIVFEIIYSI